MTSVLLGQNTSNCMSITFRWHFYYFNTMCMCALRVITPVSAQFALLVYEPVELFIRLSKCLQDYLYASSALLETKLAYFRSQKRPKMQQFMLLLLAKIFSKFYLSIAVITLVYKNRKFVCGLKLYDRHRLIFGR